MSLRRHRHRPGSGARTRLCLQGSHAADHVESGTRQRVIGYRNRILAEDLLAICAEHTAVDPATAALELEA